jgi:hypothetical protein
MNLLELRSWLQEQTLTPQADATINGYINQAYLDLATAHDWAWLEVTTTFNFDDGATTEFPLPADFNRLRALFYTAQGAEAQPIRTTRDAVLHRLGDDIGESDLPGEYYRQGSNIKFAPSPTGTQEVALLYYQRPAPLAADEDEPAFDAAFHVYLAQAAAALYFESEDSFEHAGYYHSKAADTFVRLAEFYDLQMPPEQPLVIGGGRSFTLRRRPFTGYETDSGV